MSNAKNGENAFTLRSATENDLPTLVDFLAKLALHVSGGPPQTLKEGEYLRLKNVLMEAMVDPNRYIVVAEMPKKRLVGMGDIFIWRSSGIWEQASEEEYRSGMIDDVWVEPEYRGLGVFTLILDELVSFAEKRGAQELILEYSATNREAESAWTKLGFKTTGVRAAAFTSHVRALLEK